MSYLRSLSSQHVPLSESPDSLRRNYDHPAPPTMLCHPRPEVIACSPGPSGRKLSVMMTKVAVIWSHDFTNAYWLPLKHLHCHGCSTRGVVVDSSRITSCHKLSVDRVVLVILCSMTAILALSGIIASLRIRMSFLLGILGLRCARCVSHVENSLPVVANSVSTGRFTAGCDCSWYLA